MKRLFFCICVYIISNTASAQNWQTVNLDSVISVSLPKGYLKKDTLGQHIYTAETLYGNILVLKDPDNPEKMPDIEKERHLKKYYNDYLKKIGSSSAGGTISGEKDTLIGKLRVKDFTLQVDSGTGKQFRNFRLIHENCATYIFEYLYQDIHEELAKGEKEEFFNSIKAALDPSIQSQFTANTPDSNKGTNKNLYIFGGAGILIVLILLVIIITRRKRKTPDK